MVAVPKVLLDFKVESLTNGSVTLGINTLTVDTFEFNWVFLRNDIPVLIKVVTELSNKLLPDSLKAT
jgi:multidrug resistance efflux pump